MGGGASKPIDLYPIENRDLVAIRDVLKVEASIHQVQVCSMVHFMKEKFLRDYLYHRADNFFMCQEGIAEEIKDNWSKLFRHAPPGSEERLRTLIPTFERLIILFQELYCTGNAVHAGHLHHNLNLFIDSLCSEETVNLASAYGTSMFDKHFLSEQARAMPAVLPAAPAPRGQSIYAPRPSSNKGSKK